MNNLNNISDNNSYYKLSKISYKINFNIIHHKKIPFALDSISYYNDSLEEFSDFFSINDNDNKNKMKNISYYNNLSLYKLRSL